MIPLYNAEGPQYVLGMPCAQNRLALPTWSYAFEILPPKQIIEIGSGTGAFTIALAASSDRYGTRVLSVDQTKSPTQEFHVLSDVLRIEFVTTDTFEPETVQLILDWIQMPGTSYVLCDGGDKPKEMSKFAEFLKPGDVIGAHDFYTTRLFWGWKEIEWHEGETIAKLNKLERWMPDEFSAAAWLVYRKKA